MLPYTYCPSFFYCEFVTLDTGILDVSAENNSMSTEIFWMLSLLPLPCRHVCFPNKTNQVRRRSPPWWWPMPTDSTTAGTAAAGPTLTTVGRCGIRRPSTRRQTTPRARRPREPRLAIYLRWGSEGGKTARTVDLEDIICVLLLLLLFSTCLMLVFMVISYVMYVCACVCFLIWACLSLWNLVFDTLFMDARSRQQALYMYGICLCCC